MRIYFVPNVYIRGYVCVFLLLQLSGSFSEMSTKPSFFDGIEKDEGQLGGDGGSSSINTVSQKKKWGDNLFM